MSKTAELNELFKEWQENHDFDIFCEDGIVDEEIYNNQKIKVLFALKDLHLDEKGRKTYADKIDMRDHVCDKEDWRTWNPIALWTKALLEGTPFEETTDKAALREKYLKKISFMNLKKEAGKEYVANVCVECYAGKNIREIKREIEIIDPDIVIACSSIVFKSLKDIIFKNDDMIWGDKIEFNDKMKQYGQCFDISHLLNRNKPVYVVEYRHPVDYGKGSCTAKEHYNNMLEIRKSLLD